MDEIIIQKRLSNWADHLLKRLQVLYDRGDFCDLILQFHTNQILKVHRVVVNLCTEYFANHERNYGLQNGMLVLPKDIEYNSVVTIVKFFYTGKLEVKETQFNDILRTVKLMNILILTKLLESHNKKSPTNAKKEPSRPIVFKQQGGEGGNRPIQKLPSGTIIHEGSTITMSPNTTTVTAKNISNMVRPLTTLPSGVKTKTVLARVQSQPLRVTANHQGKLVATQQKKLPFWKERKFAPQTGTDPAMLEKWPPRDEPPRPTRFEWPDESDSDPYLTPATHTLMDRQKANSTQQQHRKAEDIFDAVSKNQGLSFGMKRSMPTTSSTITGSDSSIKVDVDDSPASKVAKVMVEHPSTSSDQSMIVVSMSSNDLTNVDSSMSDVNLTEETIEEEVSTTEGYSQEIVESSTTMSEDVGSSVMYSEEESCSSEISISSTPSSSKNTISIVMSPLAQAKRSSIKSGVGSMTASGLHKVEKTVRFAPEVEKENNKNKPVTVQSSSPTVMVPKNIEAPSSSNHSKIISEVLKKYPDLVKDHKNIKLKIVHKEPGQVQSSASPTKDSKSKVSYIVLKSTSAPDSPGSMLLKKPVMNKAFWDSDKTGKKLPSGAENTTGPWLCSPCGTDDIPIEFETYHAYRRHLVDIHNERIDARICEYCGQKASKRNLLLYHMYTKHGINPPKNCSFPHCERCDYVALSDSLMVKHKQGHDANKEFSCTICNASFKSNGALQGHMAANLHRNKDTKVYECPYCRKPFVRNINLKAHIRSLHKDVARIEEMDDPRLPPDETFTSRAVTIVHSGVKKRQFPSILGGTRLSGNIIQEQSEDLGQNMEGLVRSLVTADGQTIEILHHGIDPNTMSVPVQLVQSSEAEALTNVATSIAASLGLEHGQVGAEFMTGVNSDGTPAVFIMDGSQNAVEVDVSNVGVGIPDGSMLFENDQTGGSEQFIVQDMQGNQFRKIEAIDETGKQVIFFQLHNENGQMTMAPGILDDSVARFDDGQGDGGGAHFDFESGQAHFSVNPQKCSVFVNTSSGMSLPVTVSSDGVMSLSSVGSSVPGGSVIELVSATHAGGGHEHHNTIVTTESLMNQVQQCSVVSSDQHQHLLQTSQGQVPVTVDHMGQLQVIQEAIDNVQVQVAHVLQSVDNKQSGEIIIEQIGDMAHLHQQQQQLQEQHETQQVLHQEQHLQHEEQQQQQQQDEHDHGERYVQDTNNVVQDESIESHIEVSHIVQDDPSKVVHEESTQIIHDENTQIMHDESTQIIHSENTQIINEDETEIVQQDNTTDIIEDETQIQGEEEDIHHIVQQETQIEGESHGLHEEVHEGEEESHIEQQETQIGQEDHREQEEIQTKESESLVSQQEGNVEDQIVETIQEDVRQEPIAMEEHENHLEQQLVETGQEIVQQQHGGEDNSHLIIEEGETENSQVVLQECMEVDEASTNVQMEGSIHECVSTAEGTVTEQFVQPEIIEEDEEERNNMVIEIEQGVVQVNQEEEVEEESQHLEEEQVCHNGLVSSDSEHNIPGLVVGEQVEREVKSMIVLETDNNNQPVEETAETSDSLLFVQQVEVEHGHQEQHIEQQQQQQQQEQQKVQEELMEEEESIERIEQEVQRDLINNEINNEVDTQEAELMVCVEEAVADV